MLASQLTWRQLDEAIDLAIKQDAEAEILRQLRIMRDEAFARSSDRPRKPHVAEIRDVRIANRGVLGAA